MPILSGLRSTQTLQTDVYSWWPRFAVRIIKRRWFEDHPLASLVRGPFLQLSFDVRNSLSRSDLFRRCSGSALVFQPLIGFPNFLELTIGERWVLVVTNWNMRSLKSVRPIVRNQIHLKLCVEPQLLFVKQADDRSNTEAYFGFPKPGIHGLLRYLARRFLLYPRSWSSCKLILNYPPKHGKIPLSATVGPEVYTQRNVSFAGMILKIHGLA